MGKKRTRKAVTTPVNLASLDDAALLLEVQRRKLLPASPPVAPPPPVKQAYNNNVGGTPSWWAPDEDERLASAVEFYGLARIGGASAWPTIAKAVGTRTNVQCRRRWDYYMREKKRQGVTIESAPPPVGEVTKAVDVNTFFDQQLEAPQLLKEGEDQVSEHYGLLALETFDDTDAPMVVAKKTTEIIGARRALSFAFDAYPLCETTDTLTPTRQRYEAQLREQQAEVTRKEIHRRLTLQRAATLEIIASS